MRKRHALILAGLMVAATAATAVAAEYDRYERGPRGGSYGEYAPPPPPRGAQIPPPRHAQYGQPYFFAHLGIFDPNDDSSVQPDGGLRGYDSGGSFELGIGSRVSPVFAVDGTIGAYGSKRGSDKATVVPMTIGGRLIIPHPFIEPYLGAGLGLYATQLKDAFRGIDDSSTDFGGYFSLGADFWLNPRVAFNFEGKYHWVTSTFQSNLGSEDVNLGGWTVNLGVRVAF
ncbi:MAG: outer membrane beta-barrel protein [Candidatus Deferrimicrobium sp.]